MRTAPDTLPVQQTLAQSMNLASHVPSSFGGKTGSLSCCSLVPVLCRYMGGFGGMKTESWGSPCSPDGAIVFFVSDDADDDWSFSDSSSTSPSSAASLLLAGFTSEFDCVLKRLDRCRELSVTPESCASDKGRFLMEVPEPSSLEEQRSMTSPRLSSGEAMVSEI